MQLRSCSEPGADDREAPDGFGLAATKFGETLNGNAIGEIGTFTKADGTTGEVAEAFFRNDRTDSRFTGDYYTLGPTTLLLPNARGYGVMPDLYVVMSKDPTLEQMVADFADDASITSWRSSLSRNASPAVSSVSIARPEPQEAEGPRR